jgi:exodeoxyribonuclease VII large subunit
MTLGDPVMVGDRKVYPVAAFNGRLREYLRRVKRIWVEGEVSELRRNEAWATVFLTLCGAGDSRLRVQMPRRRYDQLGFTLADGDRIQVMGDLDLYEAKGDLVFRASTVERAGEGDQLAALERLKRTLAAEGLFAEARKRPLPRFPRAVGLLTGSDAAARGDVIAALRNRFPATRLVIAETRVQGPKAAPLIVTALRALAAHSSVDVIVLARGGGSVEDLLPFSDERVVREVAAVTVPIVSAVGHEQDTPLCDLAADVRAATPTAAVRLVVPDAMEFRAELQQERERLGRASHRRLSSNRELVGRQRERIGIASRRALDRDRVSLLRTRERLSAAPTRLLERRRGALDTLGAALQPLSPQATLARGYAVVRAQGRAIRDAATLHPDDPLEIELAAGLLTARVEEIMR